MATNALQSKLNEALTTNAAGDIALRTQTEGDQTMSSLTMTGDIDGGGNYLLDDQTTTNMMSRGMVYRFDGNDYIDCGTTLGTSIGDNYTGSLSFVIDFKAEDTAPSGGDGLLYIGDFAASQGEVGISIFNNEIVLKLNNAAWNLAVPFTSTSWTRLVVIYSAGSEANSIIYINGVEVAGTTTGTFPSSAAMDFAGLKTIIGATYSSNYTLTGEISGVSILNFAPTAAEVKDLISGNTPFKWIGGSQTLIVPSDDCADDDTANWTDVNCALSHAASEYTMTVTTGATAASTWDEAALTVGKEYTATVLFKDGTGAGATASINVLTNAGASLAVGTPITVAAAYAEASVTWIATETNNKVQLLVAASSVGDGETVLEDIK
jgi:hypothetical protein